MFTPFLRKVSKTTFFSDYFQNGAFLAVFETFLKNGVYRIGKKSLFLRICHQYLWIDTPHAYGKNTLKLRFLMGWVKK